MEAHVEGVAYRDGNTRRGTSMGWKRNVDIKTHFTVTPPLVWQKKESVGNFFLIQFHDNVK